MAEVRLRDLQVGTRYKMRDPIVIQNVVFQGQSGHIWIQGTIQADLDRIHGSFFTLERLDENAENNNGNPTSFDATFTIPNNDLPIHVPADLNEEGEARDRFFIFLSNDALPQGDDTIFLTEGGQNVGMYYVSNNNNNDLIGGRRKRKQRKTKKQKRSRKASRKQKKRSTRRRRT